MPKRKRRKKESPITNIIDKFDEIKKEFRNKPGIYQMTGKLNAMDYGRKMLLVCGKKYATRASFEFTPLYKKDQKKQILMLRKLWGKKVTAKAWVNVNGFEVINGTIYPYMQLISIKEAKHG